MSSDLKKGPARLNLELVTHTPHWPPPPQAHTPHMPDAPAAPAGLREEDKEATLTTKVKICPEKQQLENAIFKYT